MTCCDPARPVGSGMPSVEAEERENPNTDGFRIELIGEIANMATLSTGTAESVGSELRRASVKVVAGEGFEPSTFRL